ncbi:hypothetical protein [Aerosakkonema funiforme]|uniref:hypothetical protein n=1 Tax=Aerosakkonema funiforme TaxID=1246630 RepID=UPI0035B92CEC
MRFIRRRLVAILVVASIVIFGEIALGNTIAKNQELIEPPVKITEAFKNIPYNPDSSQEKNISRNPDPSISDEPKAINDFAWKDFIALNWPVDCQGKPLYSTDPLSGQKYPKIIGQAPEAPRRWELYPSPKDVFGLNAETPPSLDKLPEVDRCLNDRAGSEIQYNQNLRLTEAEELVTEKESSEYKIASIVGLLDGNGELKSELNINGNPVKISLSSIDAANKIPLVDRQGNYVINEIRLNPVEFKQIVEKKWFDASNLLDLKNSYDGKKLFQLVCSSGSTLTKEDSDKYCDTYKDEGAIEIKAVWRVFDERNTEEEKARYYRTERKIVSEKGEILEEQAELGLIGFHIMHKTSSRGWIWSTFEHIDNAPPCDVQKTKQYTLYNNECNTKNCKENEPYVKPPYLWDISNKEPKAVTIEVSEGTAVKDQVSSQICRANPISNLATKQNKEWQKSLIAIAESSVWQYYQLIGTQWLLHPEIPYSNQADGKDLRRRQITPNSQPLTNVALEPYAQGVSCIVCHTSARLWKTGDFCELNKDPRNCADFSFLMDNAKSSKQITINQN